VHKIGRGDSLPPSDITEEEQKKKARQKTTSVYKGSHKEKSFSSEILRSYKIWKKKKLKIHGDRED